MGFFRRFWWMYILCIVVVLPTLAQEQSDDGHSGLSIGAPDVATVNQTIEVVVTSSSSGNPVHGAIVFFTFQAGDMQIQRTTDEMGIATFTPKGAGRLYVLAHKSGVEGAEVVIDVRDAPEYVPQVNESATPQSTDTGAGSPGFGCAAPIILLAYAIRKVLNR